MRVAALSLVLLAGCQVGFKTAAGGATSPTGYGKGVSRSLTFADQGLVLSRLGLGFLAVGAAAGAVEHPKTEVSTWTTGDTIVVEKKTTADINTGTAQNAADIANAAGDSNTKLTSASGGLASRLEIAGETLGGDTHGWQYELGYSYRQFLRLGPLASMFRIYAGVGYGSFDYNDRVMTGVDRGPPKFGDTSYDFFGLYGRAGLFLMKRPTEWKDLIGIEAFGTVSANASGASYAGIGGRFQWALLFGEVEMQAGSSSDDKTYLLHVGAGFF